MAWCGQDADLLMTCGKDNRILCWNPNSATQMGEVIFKTIFKKFVCKKMNLLHRSCLIFFQTINEVKIKLMVVEC